MADTVTSQTLQDGSKRTIRKFTNISDGTGESGVTKVDISGLEGAPTTTSIMQIWWVTDGMNVQVLFDHTTDDTAIILGGFGYLDFREIGGLRDPGSSGGTGDILFTTIAHSLNDAYTVVLDIEIK